LWESFASDVTVSEQGGWQSVKTLVLGVGNNLLTDEGAGVHAVRHLEARCGKRDDIEFVDAGTLSFTLAGVIDDCGALIVIDAAELKQSPGTVRLFEREEMDRFLARNRKLSVHEVSLLDLLAMAQLAGRLPERRALIGIQPGQIDWGERPSEPVAAALPAAGDLALSLIARWSAHEAQ
jgi:hydrogenase maturation protease